MDRTERLERYRTGTGALEAAIAGITEEELDRPQPDDEWTARHADPVATKS